MAQALQQTVSWPLTMHMRSPVTIATPPHAVARYPAPATLAGQVERVLFHNPSGPYTVALLQPDGPERPVGVAGSFPEVRPGEYLRCSGSWEIHARFGRQFRATDVTLVLPASAAGIRRYLSSPFVSGIGPVTAHRLVEQFGGDTLAALDAGPTALQKAPGIGPHRAQRISASWQQHQAVRDVMLTLFDYGLSYRRAEQLYQHYGAVAPLIIRSDPYRLTLDIRGIGFLTADRIASSIGIPADAPGRLQAGLLHCLRAAAIAGHVWLPASRVLEEGEALLAKRSVSTGDEQRAPIGAAQLGPALQALVDSNTVASGLVAGEPALALAALDNLERALAIGLLQLSEGSHDRMPFWSQLDDSGWSQAFVAYGGSADRLSLEQRAAVRLALTERVAVLTGGPGTGKTTTLRVLVALALGQGARIALAAPTGRAARRLAEATGLEARTIHRLLGRRGFASPAADEETDLGLFALEGMDDRGPDAAARGKSRSEARLSADLVVIDEASMLDLPLARALVRAVPAGAHLLLVGDADQLPSVGPGQVLADIIASGRFPVCRLQRIFRQGEGSGIAANAQRINAGEMPVWEPGLGSNDFYLFNADDATACRSLVLDLVTRRIPARFALAGGAIQVLAPMHRGPLGLSTLNPELQAALNPPDPARPELSLGSRLLRLGDRVVQSRNNYDLGVFNGDMGTIIALDPGGFTVTVRLDDGRDVTYSAAALPELHLAYALSIHRAQGSEFPVVVLPVVTGQFILLSRRLLYTAVTRAQRLVVLVGHSRAVSFAVRDAGSEARITALAERLQHPPTPPVVLPRQRSRRRGATQPSLL